jgi:hypothetical protein
MHVQAEGEDAKGEDWEHEEERADDDLDMGEDGEDAEASPTPPCAAPAMRLQYLFM